MERLVVPEFTSVSCSSQSLELPHLLSGELSKASRRHHLVSDRRVDLDLSEVGVSALLVVLDHSNLEQEGSHQPLIHILRIRKPNFTFSIDLALTFL